MPWVRLDDRFPSHRKVALLSDRAFRLYVSALCWSSENLTEGRILARELPVITRIRNAKATAKELEDAGLWDRAPDGWLIHDYLVYNPDRAKVKAERAANAARQQAFRDRKRAEREAGRNGTSNGARNAVTDAPFGTETESSAGKTRHDGGTNARETDQTNNSSPQVSAIRNGVSNGTPSRPVLPLSMREEEEERLTDANAASAVPPTVIGTGPRIPVNARPLVDAITAAGMIVGWDLSTTDWFVIEDRIQRCGIPALVQDAMGSWQGAREPVRSGKYFLPAWRKLPDIPEDTRHLPAVVNGPTTPRLVSRQQQETDDQFDRAMNRARTRMES